MEPSTVDTYFNYDKFLKPTSLLEADLKGTYTGKQLSLADFGAFFKHPKKVDMGSEYLKGVNILKDGGATIFNSNLAEEPLQVDASHFLAISGYKLLSKGFLQTLPRFANFVVADIKGGCASEIFSRYYEQPTKVEQQARIYLYFDKVVLEFRAFVIYIEESPMEKDTLNRKLFEFKKLGASDLNGILNKAYNYVFHQCGMFTNEVLNVKQY